MKEEKAILPRVDRLGKTELGSGGSWGCSNWNVQKRFCYANKRLALPKVSRWLCRYIHGPWSNHFQLLQLGMWLRPPFHLLRITRLRQMLWPGILRSRRRSPKCLTRRSWRNYVSTLQRFWSFLGSVIGQWLMWTTSVKIWILGSRHVPGWPVSRPSYGVYCSPSELWPPLSFTCLG